MSNWRDGQAATQQAESEVSEGLLVPKDDLTFRKKIGVDPLSQN
jgi:hypothetical protein